MDFDSMELGFATPNQLLNAVHYVVGKASRDFVRDGIILEKGAVVSERRIDAHYDLYTKYCELWSVYPDLCKYGA